MATTDWSNRMNVFLFREFSCTKDNIQHILMLVLVWFSSSQSVLALHASVCVCVSVGLYACISKTRKQRERKVRLLLLYHLAACLLVRHVFVCLFGMTYKV